MQSNQLYDELIAMGCKVITERPEPFEKLSDMKPLEKPQSLKWELINEPNPHLESGEWAIYRSQGTYSLHFRGVIRGRFGSNLEARRFAQSHEDAISNTWVGIAAHKGSYENT